MKFLFIIAFTWLSLTFSYGKKEESVVSGQVTSGEKYVPFATVVVKGTTIGTLTDEEGRYYINGLPQGEITLHAQLIGYKSSEKTVFIDGNKELEVGFNLEEDVLNLNELIVSASRSESKRNDAPVIVNTLSPKLFTVSQSVTLGESLNFCPGLRLENNCQNCGFTQVRMNGMEGPYSQILINSRPIFSGLAGVYGLELIPSNMIEKVEVVRGGGSALFGSNAIAGTINLILKDPVRNSFEAGTNYNVSGINSTEGNGSGEVSVNFNGSVVDKNNTTGLSLYGFRRNRDMFDANGDGFSEIALMENLTFGSRAFYRPGARSKITVDFFTIHEKREGGNDYGLPLHERDVAEAVTHDLSTLALTFEHYFRHYDLFSVYASGQFLNRDSYYGANQSLSDYGRSEDRTFNIGSQYKFVFETASLILGLDNTSGFLSDKKLGYPDYENAVIRNGNIISVPHVENTLVSDQSSVTTGAFLQYDMTINSMKIAIGGRLDHYRIEDFAKENSDVKRGNVFSPRLSVMYNFLPSLKGRLSYSQGYRAPQIFDEDLHIETSGSRKVVNVNAPELKQETSHSLSGSFDFNGMLNNMYTGLLIEGFYTRLDDPFVNHIGTPDEDGTVYYTRENAEEGATVSGINMEFKIRPSKKMTFNAGYTIQKSRFDVAQEFNEKQFFRTPNQYGYFAFDWDFIKGFCFSSTGNYTGTMLVPYFGPETDPDEGELRTSPHFFDFGMKLSYTLNLKGTEMEFHTGVKNLFNSYQSDFDSGPDRDPAYMYGPVNPQTFYIGIKFGNALK